MPPSSVHSVAAHPYVALVTHASGIHPTTSRLITVDLVTFNEAGEIGEDFHAGDTEFDLRRSDETHRYIFYSGEFPDSIETAQLSAVGIAPHRNTHGSQVNRRIIQQLLHQKGRYYQLYTGNAIS